MLPLGISQLRKEFPNIQKQQAVLEASKKMMLPILYTVLTQLFAPFLSLIFEWNKTHHRFWLDDDLGFNCFINYYFSSLAFTNKYFSTDGKINVKNTEKSLITSFFSSVAKKNNFLYFQ